MLFKSIIILCLSIFNVGISNEIPQFTSFIKNYNKEYSNDEILNRFNIFQENIQKINNHNNQNNSWKMGVNKFADLSPEEFKRIYTSLDRPSIRKNKTSFSIINTNTPPNEIDWVSLGAVTNVKDQGQCGSCWAFSTTGSIEGAYYLANKKLVSLSEQQLVDCSSSFGNEGCNGGLMDNGFEYVKSNGLCSEKSYSYKGVDGLCKKCNVVTKIDSYIDVTPNDEQSLLQAVSKQPVSVAIEADKSIFQFYQSGVMDSDSCGTNLDHGVLIVGYGTQNGKDFWKVKNSWGSSWGNKGYILLGRNSKSKQGICGIMTEPSYPVISN